MEQKLDAEYTGSTTGHSLKSSLDPTATTIIEVPEEQLSEQSPDFEADPSVPDTIDPELINPAWRKPLDNQQPDEAMETDSEPEMADDLVQEEIASGIREKDRISNPDAGI